MLTERRPRQSVQWKLILLLVQFFAAISVFGQTGGTSGCADEPELHCANSIATYPGECTDQSGNALCATEMAECEARKCTRSSCKTFKYCRLSFERTTFQSGDTPVCRVRAIFIGRTYCRNSCS